MTIEGPAWCAILIPLAGGLISSIGVRNAVKSDWFQDAEKSTLQPRPWVFGIAWTILYLLLGVVTVYLFFNSDENQSPDNSNILWQTQTVFIIQLVLNFMWTPIFFIARRVDIALVLLSIILLLSIFVEFGLIIMNDVTSSSCFFFYTLWLCFALILNMKFTPKQ